MSSTIVIAGGGVFGLACGWEMTRRGARVRVVEAAHVGAGASGGMLGALTPFSPETWDEARQVQRDSLLAAEEFWAGVAQASGVDPGYARIGRLTLAPDPDTAAARIAAAATRWPAGMGMRLTRGTGPLAADGLWLEDRLSARVAPRPALAALAAAIRAGGGAVVERMPAPPSATLWATGAAGLMALSDDLGRGMGGGQKGQAAVLGFDAGPSPQLSVAGLHAVPHADGTTAVGSTSERDFADLAPDARLDALVERLRGAVPALADAPVLERWAGLRPRAATRWPLLGPWPGRPGRFVANGGFKIGFGLAPWVAAAMADLILDGHDRIPAGWRL